MTKSKSQGFYNLVMKRVSKADFKNPNFSFSHNMHKPLIYSTIR